MAPPSPATTSPSSYQDLVQAFTDFLTVSIHTILYERAIYPEHSFIKARRYNHPVRQNRHPRVCTWINDAVSAVQAELLKCCVDRVAVVIYSPDDLPLERFMYDVSRFPVVPASERLTPLVRLAGVDEGEKRSGLGSAIAAAAAEEEAQGKEAAAAAAAVLPLVDMEEQFRAAMSRLSGCGERLGRQVVDGCTFTVAVELKDEAEPPVGHPQAWIPAQPPVQRNRGHLDHVIPGKKTTPVRTISAGEMVFEMWIEESVDKTKDNGTMRRQSG